MEENKNSDTLLIDKDYEPVLTESEAREFKPILKDFVGAYAENHDKDVKEWLPKKIHEHLPEYSEKDVNDMTDAIILSIRVSDKCRDNLDEAQKKGITRESWLANQALNATSGMSAQEAAKYLTGLDNAISSANEAMRKTITTSEGLVNQNPHLDGFIAEQYHAQTFNLDAKVKGSKYHAEVLEPKPGERYGKNSVDIQIKDAAGKVVKRYQSKYCENAEATAKAFEKGDYRGQQKLVPEEQATEIPSKTTTRIEVEDGKIASKSLTKEDAKSLQNEAQKNGGIGFDYNDFDAKAFALQIGKRTALAGVQGAAISVGFDIAQKCWNGEKIDAKEEVKVALKSGADFGLKAATGAALKVGSEKGILKAIPKGTPASVLANIAFVAIENVKVLAKAAAKKLTPREAVGKMADVTSSAVGGLIGMGKGTGIGSGVGTVAGTAVGTAIGSLLGGPVGAMAGASLGLKIGSAVGGFVGGSVGYIAGSKFGKTICDTSKSVVKTAVSVAKNVASAVVGGIKKVGSFFKNLGKKETVLS